MGGIDWDLVAIRAFLLAIPFFVVACIVLAIRQLRMPFERKFRRVYDGLDVSATQRPGMILFRFHTYDGIVAWITRTPHVVFAPPDDARTLLSRLVRYNLTWGMLSFGGLFVPIFIYFGRRAQLQSIAVQERIIREGEPMLSLTPAPRAIDFGDTVPTQPSAVMKVAARFMVFFAIVFAVTAVSAALKREWGPFAGMLAMAGFIAIYARDILRPRR
jgi:hypothetical protein